jgi:hypothetical protein
LPSVTLDAFGRVGWGGEGCRVKGKEWGSGESERERERERERESVCVCVCEREREREREEVMG